jgi:hypothetical protein
MPEKHADELADQVAKLLMQVYEIHDNIINATGGLPGLRDATVLHAAAARPYASSSAFQLPKKPCTKSRTKILYLEALVKSPRGSKLY